MVTVGHRRYAGKMSARRWIANAPTPLHEGTRERAIVGFGSFSSSRYDLRGVVCAQRGPVSDEPITQEERSLLDD
jgi:hypothetical protein